ncbi:DNA-binding domain-containing protein [Phenylobacterium sp.]|uniref:DNA-binding domain-containing protein n=1 Tax=Phenylobacterium sp. TaxID=1871053 RepID=UPI00391A757E
MPDGFHEAFVAALGGDDTALAGWAAADPAPGLSVHRNTIAKGCADALAAQFPTVAKLVGEAWLKAAAVEHARAHPPESACLLAYGADFSAWLAGFPPAADMPHLAGVAALDMLWTEAHLAADADPLAPAALTALTPDDVLRCGLALHPAARFAAFDTTVPSLWLALQRDPPPRAFELQARPEGLLFARPGLDIAARRIGPGQLALLAACRDGGSLAAAGAAALAAEPDLALAPAFAELLELGAFQTLVSLELR